MAIRLSRTREAKAHLTAPFHVTDRNWRLKTIEHRLEVHLVSPVNVTTAKRRVRFES